MATYKWSSLTNEQVINFDSTIDKIVIDLPTYTWNSMTMWTWDPTLENFILGDKNKQVTFAGLSPTEVKASTLTFINPFAGKFLYGDMLTTTGNDNNTNIIGGSIYGDLLGGLGGDDALYGSSGDDRLVGGSGNDYIDGGDGFDIAFYSRNTLIPVFADLDLGHGYQDGHVDTFISIEGLRGGPLNDVLMGNAGNNFLGGDFGDDVLVGAGGSDNLAGYTGNDVFMYVNYWDSQANAADTIRDFQAGDRIQFDDMAGIDLNVKRFGWQGSVGATLTAIRNASTLNNVAVFFTNGTDGWLTIKGSGLGDNYDNTLINLPGRSTTLTSSDFRGSDGIETVHWQKETPSGTDNSGDLYGACISGNDDSRVVVVGAPGDDDFGNNAGAVYVYQWMGNERVLMGKVTQDTSALAPNDTVVGDGFGCSVANEGALTIIGAANDDLLPNGTIGNDSGGAFIYRYVFDRDSWVQEAHLVANLGKSAHLGAKVEISGDWAAVATDATNPSDQGVVLFHYANGQWSQHSFLTGLAHGYTDGGEFGRSIALDNGILVVGAEGDDTKGQDAGAAYVYRYNSISDTWVQQGFLTDASGTAGDHFGAAVDVAINKYDGREFIAVGAPGDTTGSAAVYQFNGTSWQKKVTLTPSMGQAGDQFGVSVYVEEDGYVEVGTANGTNGILAYMFETNGSNWWEETRLTAPDGGFGNQTISRPVAFGHGAESFVVGLTSDQTNGNDAGAAYFFWSDDGSYPTAGNDWLIGEEAADTLYGLAGNDILYGLENDDTLYGGDGNDTLDGGLGNDTLIGGLGNDTYIINVSTDIVTELAGQGTDLIQTFVSYSLVDTDGAGSNGGNVENLQLLGTANINGTGNGLNNTIYANNGINSIDGGAGNDTVSYLYAATTGTSGITLNLSVLNASGQATATGISGADLVKNIENITGSKYIDNLTGNSAANILDGGSGKDTMIGGLGNDTYYVDNAGDITTETSTLLAEIDTVYSSVTRTLGPNLERLYLTGTAAINGTGNTLNNALIGNSGNNILNGGTGIDTMIGGLGNDTYYVDNTGDITTETSALSTEIDTVYSSVTRTLGSNVERLTLTGTAAINGTGNILANTLIGNSAANILNGAAGSDVLNGGLGNDTLTGGSGLDIFVFDSALNSISNKDTITDFIALDDTIRLDKTIFSKLTVDTLATGNFRSSTTGAAADTDDYVLYNNTTGALFYDADGTGTSSAAILFATLSTTPTITAADFAVVA